MLEIWLKIAAANTGAADRVLDQIERRVSLLENSPAAGPSRPDIAPTARALVVRPYLVLYRVLPKSVVQIVRVLHGARKIDLSLFLEGIE
ncbi:type II toxin-antitoxin system RelE/ParE family toxin [Oleomonas cavernae]|uniref:type II toxin-antitoxin system RelE/ParE family toxin n=1 Tax=Oleomonas cavernae TaxID=2320859 RepID=UPI0038D1ED0B